MKHITLDYWIEFERRFPDALSFLRRASLECELKHLRCADSHFLPTEWERNRLKELEQWERSIKETEGVRHA